MRSGISVCLILVWPDKMMSKSFECWLWACDRVGSVDSERQGLIAVATFEEERRKSQKSNEHLGGGGTFYRPMLSRCFRRCRSPSRSSSISDDFNVSNLMYICGLRFVLHIRDQWTWRNLSSHFCLRFDIHTYTRFLFLRPVTSASQYVNLRWKIGQDSPPGLSIVARDDINASSDKKRERLHG